MAEDSMSPADIMALTNNGMGGNGMWNNPFMYLIWLAIFGNAGFGGWGGGNAAAQGTVTRAELADGLNNQTVLNALRDIDSNVASASTQVQATGAGLSQQLCNGLSNVNSNISNGFNNIGLSILNNTNGISQAINQASSAQQIANCNLSHAIQNNKYEMAQNTSTITNAVHQEGELTRKAICDNTIQDLRDKLADKASELQSAQLTLANSSQTNSILNTLGRFVPYAGYGCSGNSW